MLSTSVLFAVVQKPVEFSLKIADHFLLLLELVGFAVIQFGESKRHTGKDIGGGTTRVGFRPFFLQFVHMIFGVAVQSFL